MVSEEEQKDEERPKMSHLMIPAAYSSGVTLFALRDSDVGRELLNTSELPLLWFYNSIPADEINS